MPVNLVIKSAAQTVEDFSVECEMSWTIGHIKEQIAELYPTKPKKENQKLIYGGKLLPDHLCLSSILNHSQERHIMHLVCPSPENMTTQNESKQGTSSPPPLSIPPENSAFTPLSQPILHTQGFSGIPAVNVAPFAPGDALQQYLAMQQMYTQFMTQYLSQYNGGVPPVLPYSPVTTVPPVQTPQVPAPQQNAPLNPPQRPGDEEIRDYLDYVYIFSRAVMLFAVLFYYSSLHRVLIVVGMFLLISVYVKMHRQNQQDRQRQAANERQRIESAVTQQPPAAADIQVGNQDTTPSAPASTEEASLSQQAEGRSFTSMVSMTISIVSAFFTSLIPADPVPVNVN